MGLGHSPSIVTNGLVGYWDAGNSRSYPGSGTTWFDLSGRNNNGTLTNNPTFSNSNGGYLNFNGTNQYATIADITGVTDFTTTDSYTVEFWIYANSTQNDTGNVDNDVVEKWSGTGGYPYVFRYYRSTQKIAIGTYNGSSSNGLDLQISSNTWWHICGVFDRARGLILGYANAGESYSTTAYNITGTSSNSSALNLMRRGNGINYATGRIASLKIYNRALSESEVKQNYNSFRGRYDL